MINCPIYETSITNPESIAISSPDLNISYKKLNCILNKISNKLLTQIDRKDAIFSIICSNELLLTVLMWAAIRTNITVCPINPSFSLEQIKNILLNIDSNYLFIDNEKIAESIKISHFHHLKIFSVQDFSTEFKYLTENINYSEYTEETPVCSSPICVDENKIANLTLTSGSTGTPKAVALTLKNHLYNAQGSNQLIKVDNNTRWLQSLPLYHVGGFAITVRCFMYGGTIVFKGNSYDRNDIMHIISDLNITHLSLVPTQLYRMLLNNFDISLSKLKYVLLGGGSITSKLLLDCIKKKIFPFISYGLSEMGSQVCTKQITNQNDIDDLNAGKVLPFREIKIINNEIAVKGETLFKGYYNKGKLTQSLDQNGYFHTKDLGYIKNNQLYLYGRIDNCFKSGGEKIQPEQIEKTILEKTDINQVIIVGIPDAEWGNKTIAIVDGDIPHNIKEILKKFLGKYEIPKEFIPWPQEMKQGLKIQRQNMLSYAIDYLQEHCS